MFILLYLHVKSAPTHSYDLQQRYKVTRVLDYTPPSLYTSVIFTEDKFKKQFRHFRIDRGQQYDEPSARHKVGMSDYLNGSNLALEVCLSAFVMLIKGISEVSKSTVIRFCCVSLIFIEFCRPTQCKCKQWLGSK